MVSKTRAPRTEQVKPVISDRMRAVRLHLFGEKGARELARRLSIPTRRWLSYENGALVPTQTVLAFLELTGCHPSWLLRGEGDMLSSRPGSRAFPSGVLPESPELSPGDAPLATSCPIPRPVRRDIVQDEMRKIGLMKRLRILYENVEGKYQRIQNEFRPEPLSRETPAPPADAAGRSPVAAQQSYSIMLRSELVGFGEELSPAGVETASGCL